MRRSAILQRIAKLFFAMLSFAAAAQAPAHRDGGSTVMVTRDGGVNEILQSIYIPPLLNAPFTAVLHTEWTRPLANGGSFTLVNRRRVARDSKGRIYEERWLLVPKGGDLESQMNVIQLADPEAHTLYNCFTLQTPRRCTLQTFAETPLTLYTPAAATTGPMPGNQGSATHEDLGMRAIDGIEARGTRDTEYLNAGVMGNDEPFASYREFWQSPSLGVNLVSEVTGLTIGKQVFTMSHVRLGEPDPRLFELPAKFAIVDQRKRVTANTQ